MSEHRMNGRERTGRAAKRSSLRVLCKAPTPVAAHRHVRAYLEGQVRPLHNMTVMFANGGTNDHMTSRPALATRTVIVLGQPAIGGLTLWDRSEGRPLLHGGRR